MSDKYDYVIFGAGIFGLYAAYLLSKKRVKILVLEYDKGSFLRASSINQSRLHNGYHYPRSFDTASSVANSYKRFLTEFSFAINNSFKSVYAISKDGSKVSSNEFIGFCKSIKIPLFGVDRSKYFKKNRIEIAFEVQESVFDYNKIKNYFLKKLSLCKNVEIFYNIRLESIAKGDREYIITLNGRRKIRSPFIINATYACVNQLINKFSFETFKIKYELCEIALCNVSSNIGNIGVTVMDGLFFSLMPFGEGKYHSLASVSHTPHLVSYDTMPNFECQKKSKSCSSIQLDNCNLCPFKPKSVWSMMHNLAKQYLKENMKMNYRKSLFAIKPILLASEIDDSRPNIIKVHSKNPYFLSILSGKMSNIYDLEKILK